MSVLSIFRKNYSANCGHKTKLHDKVFAFGESTSTQLPIKDGEIDYCHRCIEKMAIRCAWCGHTIFIGDPVTLYSPRDENFDVPEHAMVYCKDPLQLVGCLRWNCADSSADRMGFWLPPGVVHRVQSAYAICMQGLKEGNLR